MLDSDKLLGLYARLYEVYGAQHWWPARSRFEVMVGAVLTQNTSWRNVELALGNLRAKRTLSLSGLQKLDTEELARLIRPCGYYRVKAGRLRNLCRGLQQMGGLKRLAGMDTAALRQALLKINGIGAETADAILLYALERPVFVIDAYTRRLLRAMGMIAGDENYEALRQGFEQALCADTKMYNEYHALIVRHGQQKCKAGEAVDTACKHCFVETGTAAATLLPDPAAV